MYSLHLQGMYMCSRLWDYSRKPCRVYLAQQLPKLILLCRRKRQPIVFGLQIVGSDGSLQKTHSKHASIQGQLLHKESPFSARWGHSLHPAHILPCWSTGHRMRDVNHSRAIRDTCACLQGSTLGHGNKTLTRMWLPSSLVNYHQQRKTQE